MSNDTGSSLSLFSPFLPSTETPGVASDDFEKQPSPPASHRRAFSEKDMSDVPVITSRITWEKNLHELADQRRFTLTALQLFLAVFVARTEVNSTGEFSRVEVSGFCAIGTSLKLIRAPLKP